MISVRVLGPRDRKALRAWYHRAMSDAPDGTRRAVHRLPPVAKSAAFTIRVVAPGNEPVTLVVDASRDAPLTIGTSDTCEVRVTDPLVSRRHLTLDVVDAGLRIRDAGSLNGTLVNGVLVTDAILREGGTLRIGDTTIEVQRSSDRMVPLPEERAFGKLAGASVEMRRLYPRLRQLADATIPVVIDGETGTGKEVLAESLHEQGPRARQPFVVLDCTAVAPSLLEAELFGHERGAFTGATGLRQGVFELADGGTLLIDEIGDLDLPLQAKLLRAIERSEFRRVGGSKTLRVDVRILAATRRDLDREVGAGRFRDDLYHRLCVARVTLPPLRERRGDVALLANLFSEALGGAPLRDEWLARLEEHSWPGNVRELRNVVTRHVALGESSLAITRDATAARGEGVLEELVKRGLPFSLARQLAIEAFEQAYVSQMLARNDGNVSKAAREAGIGRRYFQRVRGRGTDS